MTDNFPEFAKIVAGSFQFIVEKGNAFVSSVAGDDLYQSYLAAFPEGTNPIFKERTEHDCSCCKQFVRRVGNVVAVDSDGSVLTVWDDAAGEAPYPYNEVAKLLREIVIYEVSIADIFRVKEGAFGAETTRSLGKNEEVLRWEHFYTGHIPSSHRSDTPDRARGDYRTTVQVFDRGLRELRFDAIKTVLSLIDANNLYRGAEHRPALIEFRKAKRGFKKTENKDLFTWTHAESRAARFRNTVLGTLVTDLSEGVAVERAVRAFETKVAPQNYKRTTAIITPGMVKEAMKTIEELGLESALERRFARIEDISVNDVLWVDGSVKSLMKGGIGDTLIEHVLSQRNNDVDEERADDIDLDDFMNRILSETTGMEVLFKGEHLGNLMSLTAPVHEEPKQLFRWDNDFAWSYAGNIADSIKERVKRAGGNVTNAVLRASLSWFNLDDLDIHVIEPCGDRIFFSHMRGRGGGHLDVDMNVSPTTREAVENVAWTKLPDGPYKIIVHNYTHREATDVGFVIEVECQGKLSHFNYNKEVRPQQEVDVVTLHVKNGAIERFEVGDSNITTNAVSQEKWGLQTENYVKVNAVTLSPNYWDDNAVGNKHTFFVLDGALNDEPTRGIYNEFLHSRLEQHRKVFEVIGDKTKCQPTDGQLSGLGFSSTKKDSVVVKVTQGSKQRLFNIGIG